MQIWRRRQESNPPRAVVRPSPDLKSGRPTGDDSPPSAIEPAGGSLAAHKPTRQARASWVTPKNLRQGCEGSVGSAPLASGAQRLRCRTVHPSGFKVQDSWFRIDASSPRPAASAHAPSPGPSRTLRTGVIRNWPPQNRARSVWPNSFVQSRTEMTTGVSRKMAT